MSHYRILEKVIFVLTAIYLATEVCSQTCGRSRNPPVSKTDGIFNATEGAWPWMAEIRLIKKSETSSHMCSGFLIDRRHVISAAHCFDRQQEPTLYIVKLGSINENEGQKFSVSEIVVPEFYRPGFYYHDIAILTLSREVDVPDFVPICLPDEKIIKRNFTGMGLTLVGWRSHFIASNTLYLDLLEMRGAQVLSNEACNLIYQEKLPTFRRQFPMGISTDIMCAGFPEGADSCVTSGAPLMFQDRNRWFAVGLVSFGFACGRTFEPDGYTRVSSHLEWIRENTRD